MLELLTELGFKVEGMGGNCTALALVQGGRSYLVTDGENEVPTPADVSWWGWSCEGDAFGEVEPEDVGVSLMGDPYAVLGWLGRMLGREICEECDGEGYKVDGRRQERDCRKCGGTGLSWIEPCGDVGAGDAVTFGEGRPNFGGRS